jgi:hypothetical protein
VVSIAVVKQRWRKVPTYRAPGRQSAFTDARFPLIACEKDDRSLIPKSAARA